MGKKAKALKKELAELAEEYDFLIEKYWELKEENEQFRMKLSNNSNTGGFYWGLDNIKEELFKIEINGKLYPISKKPLPGEELKFGKGDFDFKDNNNG